MRSPAASIPSSALTSLVQAPLSSQKMIVNHFGGRGADTTYGQTSTDSTLLVFLYNDAVTIHH